jgi:hypothetical protein
LGFLRSAESDEVVKHVNLKELLFFYQFFFVVL